MLAFSTLTAAFAQGAHAGPGHDGAHDDAIGHVDFRVSCSEAVRADFDRALGLLHHMMYVEARALFEAIAEADPGCGMAQWGIATTLFQPLWSSRPGEDALQRGSEAMERARASARSEREALLIDATSAFFEEGDAVEYWDRIAGWSRAMEAAYEAFPDDLDVASLYALSRIASATVADDRGPLYDEAEAVLGRIFEAEPKHPGGIHYAIHATDAEGRADGALEQVALYGDIAPDVPHALHMPSHVYVRLGDWSEVAAWNRRSADAALNFPVGERVSQHHAHALDYLLYAYLQQGDDAAARSAVDEASAAHYVEDFAAAYHLAIMPARLAVERRAWADAADVPQLEPAYLDWSRYTWPQAIAGFARGLGAAHTGRLDDAREEEAGMIALRDRAREDGEAAFATYIEIDRLVLDGTILAAEGDGEAAVERLREAAALEGTVEKHPVTPGALLPPYEALGDLLFEAGRFEEALVAYESSDGRWPGRFNTLLGAARSAAAAGEAPSARRHAERLLANAAGSTREALDEVRDLAGR